MSDPRERLTADVLDDLLTRLVRIEAQTVRTEKKVDKVLESQGRLEAAVAEISKDVIVLRRRLVEEAETRAGLGRELLAHEVELSIIRGGRNGAGNE